MKTKYKILLIVTLTSSFCFSRNKLNIYTIDIDNFWIAFDSIQKTTDEQKQISFLQTIYLDNATEGLKDFIISRDHSATRHLDNIKNYPEFWNSIRPKTDEIKNYVPTIKQDYVYLNPANNGLELHHGIRNYITKYNERRHQGINRQKPVERYTINKVA